MTTFMKKTTTCLIIGGLLLGSFGTVLAGSGGTITVSGQLDQPAGTVFRPTTETAYKYGGGAGSQWESQFVTKDGYVKAPTSIPESIQFQIPEEGIKATPQILESKSSEMLLPVTLSESNGTYTDRFGNAYTPDADGNLIGADGEKLVNIDSLKQFPDPVEVEEERAQKAKQQQFDLWARTIAMIGVLAGGAAMITMMATRK